MDKKLIADGVRQILVGILGPNYEEDVNFRETPDRVARAYEELLRGYESAKDTSVFFEKKFPADEYNSMIFCSNIKVFSMCPHHLLPVNYDMSIAYIPSVAGSVIGASKLPRLAEALAARAVVQEQLTNEIAGAIEKHLKPLGVAVVISGQHQCMRSRGVRQTESTFETSEMRGSFRNNESTRSEFFELLKNARR
jgi:GTP cyclohydrolase I